MARTPGYARSKRDYAQFDNQCDEHPKIAALSDREYRVWTRSIFYASRNLTDGLLTAAVVRDKGWSKVAPGLVKQRVWDKVGREDYMVHDYLDWNDSRADVEARIARATKAGTGRQAQLAAERDAERSAEPDAERDAEQAAERLVSGTLSPALLSSALDLEVQGLDSKTAPSAVDGPNPGAEPGQDWIYDPAWCDEPDHQHALSRLFADAPDTWAKLTARQYRSLAKALGPAVLTQALRAAIDNGTAIRSPMAWLRGRGRALGDAS